MGYEVYRQLTYPNDDDLLSKRDSISLTLQNSKRIKKIPSENELENIFKYRY